MQKVGNEISVQIRTVWMGSHTAIVGLPVDLSYAPAVIIYVASNGSRLVYPMNRYYTQEMRKYLRELSEGRSAPKEQETGLTFMMDEETDALFVADVKASPPGLPSWAAGSISFKSSGIPRTESVGFTREEFKHFADTLDRSLEAFDAASDALLN